MFDVGLLDVRCSMFDVRCSMFDVGTVPTHASTLTHPADSAPPTHRLLHHMRVNLRCFHVLMPEKFLDRADVIIRVQQMRRKTVSHHVWRDTLIQPRRRCRFLQLELEHSSREVVTPLDAAARIGAQVVLWPHPEPWPFFTRFRIFARQTLGQAHSRHIRSTVGLVKASDSHQMLPHRFDHRVRQRHQPVLVAFPSPDGRPARLPAFFPAAPIR